MAVRILVIDDEADVRRAVERALTVAGYEVLTAFDGLRALRYMDTQRFDLVIVDVFMPDLDGLGFIRELRRRRDVTPVLTISGGGDSPHSLDPDGPLAVARAFGTGVLPKPFSTEELLEAVRGLLARRRVSGGEGG